MTASALARPRARSLARARVRSFTRTRAQETHEEAIERLSRPRETERWKRVREEEVEERRRKECTFKPKLVAR